MMEIVFLREAEDDLFRSYEKWGEPLHRRIDHTLQLLRSNPELGVGFVGPFRRKLVVESPFAICYVVEPRRIVVHGIVDQRQSPEAIRRKLGGHD